MDQIARTLLVSAVAVERCELSRELCLTRLVSLLKLLPKLKVLVTLGAVPREFWAKQCFGDDDLRSRIVEVRPRRPAASRGAERVRRRRRGPSR